MLTRKLEFVPTKKQFDKQSFQISGFFLLRNKNVCINFRYYNMKGWNHIKQINDKKKKVIVPLLFMINMMVVMMMMMIILRIYVFIDVLSARSTPVVTHLLKPGKARMLEP